jgi:hypothetical protein
MSEAPKDRLERLKVGDKTYVRRAEDPDRADAGFNLLLRVDELTAGGRFRYADDGNQDKRPTETGQVLRGKATIERPPRIYRGIDWTQGQAWGRDVAVIGSNEPAFNSLAISIRPLETETTTWPAFLGAVHEMPDERFVDLPVPQPVFAKLAAQVSDGRLAQLSIGLRLDVWILEDEWRWSPGVFQVTLYLPEGAFGRGFIDSMEWREQTLALTPPESLAPEVAAEQSPLADPIHDRLAEVVGLLRAYLTDRADVTPRSMVSWFVGFVLAAVIGGVIAGMFMPLVI